MNLFSRYHRGKEGEMPAVPLKEVADQMDVVRLFHGEQKLPDTEDALLEVGLPFVHDYGPVFIFATCEGEVGLLTSNWEQLNEGLLEEVARVIGMQPDSVARGGSDFGPFDPDEDDRHEWPYLEAVWENVPLERINWLRWQLFCPPE